MSRSRDVRQSLPRWLSAVLVLAAAGLTGACTVLGDTNPGVGGAGGGETSDGGSFTTGGGPTGSGGSGNGSSVWQDTIGQTEPANGGGGGGGGGSEADCSDTGTRKTLHMSSDDSSSMGSPALAREFLNRGLAPPPAFIRPYEFLNYYRVRWEPPADGLVDVHVSYAPAPDSDSLHRLQVGVQAFDVDRPPMALTFVVDSSSSLIGEGIVRERAAIEAIASKLLPGDLVSFVVWSSKDAVVLENHEVTGPDDPALLAAAKNLVPGGGSDLHSGLKHGYELARATASKTRLSRVVLLSDGGANLGVVDRDLIAKEAKDGDDQGIYLVGIGVGPAEGYSDALMNAVTDEGRGSYVYLDSAEEATAVLAGRFAEVMDVAARAVEVELRLPSYFSVKTSSAEAISSVKSEVRPQHLAPGDSMVFVQLLSQSAPKPICLKDMIEVQVKWEAPALHPATLSDGKTFDKWESTIGELEGVTPQMLKGEAIVAYARALLTQQKGDFAKAQAAIESARADAALTADEELSSIEGLLAKFPESAKKEP